MDAPKNLFVVLSLSNYLFHLELSKRKNNKHRMGKTECAVSACVVVMAAVLLTVTMSLSIAEVIVANQHGHDACIGNYVSISFHYYL